MQELLVQKLTFYGFSAGLNSPNGGNTFIGHNTGSSVIGNSNIGVGVHASAGVEGNRNLHIGCRAGIETIGSDNIYIGNSAGDGSTGSNNIFIGHASDVMANDSNKLIISTALEQPLIWGDFANDLVKLNAKVGIGGVTSFPTTAGTINVDKYKLVVKGGILTEEVRVSLANTWADYVFNEDYKLAPLTDIECFIAENGHLPNVPSAAQVKEEGIELGDMARIQQEKIEELTLYLIQQNKRLDEQDKEIKELKAAVKVLLDKK